MPLEEKVKPAWRLRNERFMETLRSLASSIEYLEDYHDHFEGRRKIARTYIIDGARVEYLPHWALYSVNGINLEFPRDSEQIREDIRLVALVAPRLHKKTY